MLEVFFDYYGKIVCIIMFFVFAIGWIYILGNALFRGIIWLACLGRKNCVNSECKFRQHCYRIEYTEEELAEEEAIIRAQLDKFAS